MSVCHVPKFIARLFHKSIPYTCFNWLPFFSPVVLVNMWWICTYFSAHCVSSTSHYIIEWISMFWLYTYLHRYCIEYTRVSHEMLFQGAQQLIYPLLTGCVDHIYSVHYSTSFFRYFTVHNTRPLSQNVDVAKLSSNAKISIYMHLHVSPWITFSSIM